MNVRHSCVVALLSSAFSALCVVTPAQTAPARTPHPNAWTTHPPSACCPTPPSSAILYLRLQDEDDKPTQKVIGKPLTRAQAAQMTYDAFQNTLFKADDKPGHDTPFVDVRTTDPNFKAIVILARHNIASGTMENEQPVFHPKEAPSRYDLAQAMEKLIGELKPAGLDKWLGKEYAMPQDIPQSVAAYSAVEKMLKGL